MTVVVTVFSVTLTSEHAAIVHRVHTEETGTFLMEHDFHSLALAISMSIDLAKELMLESRILLHLEYITATYQQSQFIIPLISMYEIQYMSDSISMEEVRNASNTNNFLLSFIR